MSGRDVVLARIRAAIGNEGAGSAAPGTGADGSAGRYRERGELTGQALLDLLAERLTDYRALVRVATPAALADEISAALRRRQARTVVVPAALGLPLPDFAEVTADAGLTAAELDGFDAVITRAAVAIAETGTIILDGSPDQGRRAISLVPDYHLCIVTADQVVHLVPEAVARLAAAATRPLTWISGPSATSDIELERVEGVHGPRTLEVILVTAGLCRTFPFSATRELTGEPAEVRIRPPTDVTERPIGPTVPVRCPAIRTRAGERQLTGAARRPRHNNSVLPRG